MIRPLELLDLPILYRYRDNAVSLDTTRLLTRGSPLSAAGLMSYLNPQRHVYGAIIETHDPPLVGGVIHTHGETFARLLYAAPHSALASPALIELIEHLAEEAGKWGAFHITAEVDEGNYVYHALRQAGFSVYAWQRVWDLSNLTPDHALTAHWRPATSLQLSAMQSLHHQIVPALMHPFEPPPKHVSGLTCQDENARGFIKVIAGYYGIVLMPFIHPESHQVDKKLAAVLNALPRRRGRPVYLCVRSYQAWLEPVLQDLGATASKRQAVMVKHLARLVKEGQTTPAAETNWGRPATPIAHIHTKK